MVKNITISGTRRPGIAPGRHVLGEGQIHILGAARVKARRGIDRYQRDRGRAWVIEHVIAGAGYLEHGDQQYQAGPGDTYVFSPKHTYYYYPEDRDPWEKIFIEVEGAFIDSLAAAYQLDKQFFYPQTFIQKQLEHCLQLLHHSGAHMQRDMPIAIHRLISSLCLDENAASANLADFIEAHINRDFVLQDMADHYNISKNQLLRRFKQQHQCSHYEYLLQRRVEQAIWSLKNTSISVKDLAHTLQFSDSKHLSSTLKRRTGKSPREHRA